MATRRFDYFVVLAGMRTGSNLLEELLAAMPGLECHGELFNPHFFGSPGETARWGLPLAAREADPVRVLAAMQSDAKGLPGFRLFNDHDPRVIRHVLDDPRAAKIVLTRRPVDSYVSLKIARRTGQWWLGDMTSARKAKVGFDAEDYAAFLDDTMRFRRLIAHALQVSGQTAFHIGYDDLSDADVVAGLGQWLGADGPPDPARVRARVQNPTPVADRLLNPAEAEEALRAMATPDLGQLPRHEPDRGPGLRMFRACETAPLLYMPLRGAGDDPVPAWLEAVDHGRRLLKGLTQRDLRRWKRRHPGHRSFTVVRHPLPRAYDAFCRLILPAGVEGYEDLRDALVTRYEVPLPPDGPGPDWDAGRHRAAFLAFLTFLRGNLGGQTSLRVDHTWAGQATLLQAMTDFAVPDRVLRDGALDRGLSDIAAEAGVPAPATAAPHFAPPPGPPLAEIADAEIEKAAEAAYRRDYMMFGYGSWSADQAA